MSDVELSDLIDFLADLSLNAEDFEVAKSALKLQTLLLKVYGDNFL